MYTRVYGMHYVLALCTHAHTFLYTIKYVNIYYTTRYICLPIHGTIRFHRTVNCLSHVRDKTPHNELRTHRCDLHILHVRITRVYLRGAADVFVRKSVEAAAYNKAYATRAR